jgi:transcriptional regulator with XRE-family HTH domain
MALRPITLGEALRLLQVRAQVSRDELARMTDLSHGTISNYISNRSIPQANVLRRIARVLGHLLGEDPERLWSELGSVLDATDQVRLEALQAQVDILDVERG